MNNDGKILKGENGLDYLIIETRENVALLKSLAKDEYVVATDYSIIDDKEISWDYGSYYQNLMQATIRFDEQTLYNDKKIENLKEALKEATNFVTFGAIVEFELNKEKENVDEFDIDKLEIIYDNYINYEDMSLLSRDIIDLEDRYNLDTVKEDVLLYLKENNIDLNKITDEKLDEMAKDVFEYSLNSDSLPNELIFGDDYLEGELEELLSEDEEEM